MGAIPKGYDWKKGRTVPDKARIEVPLHLRNAPTMEERVRSMLRQERRITQQEMEGTDTMEEAEDFELPEDLEDLRSVHEIGEALDRFEDAQENLVREYTRYQREQRDGTREGDVAAGRVNADQAGVGGEDQRAGKNDRKGKGRAGASSEKGNAAEGAKPRDED